MTSFPSLEEFALRLNAPPTEGPSDIIEGLLPREGELVLAGETNVGKSLLALEICSCLSTGRPLWGQLEPKMQARKILYVLGEHHPNVIQGLLQKTQMPMTDTAWLLAPIHLKGDKYLFSSGRPNQQGIDKLMFWAEGCDLIVFDPLGAFVCGVDIENDNNQMRNAIDTMNGIAQSAGAALIILAHQGKPMMDMHGNEKRRKTYAIRGASAIEDAATNIFYFSLGALMTIDGKQVQSYELTLRKYKGPAPTKYTLLRNEDTLVHSLMADGSPWKSERQERYRKKLGNLQAKFNKFDNNVAVEILAAIENQPVHVMRQWLGWEA